MPRKILAVQLFCNFNASSGSNARQKIKLQLWHPLLHQHWETVGTFAMTPSEVQSFAIALKFGYAAMGITVKFEGTLMKEIESRIGKAEKEGRLRRLQGTLQESITIEE